MERKIYITKIKSYVHVIRFEYSVIESFLVFYKTVEIIFKSHSAQCQLIWGIRVQQCGRSPKFPIPGRATQNLASAPWAPLSAEHASVVLYILVRPLLNYFVVKCLIFIFYVHILGLKYIYLFDSHGTSWVRYN